MKKSTFVVGLCLSVLLVGTVAIKSLAAENLVSIETERAVGKGNVFSIAIAIKSAINLAAFQMDVSFNGSILEAVQVQEGSFLSDTGKTYWFDPKVDNDRGMVSHFLCGKTDMRGAYGDGTLATITFKAKDIGVSSIKLQNVKLSGPDGRVIPSASLDGIVTVTEFLPPDVGDYEGQNRWRVAELGGVDSTSGPYEGGEVEFLANGFVISATGGDIWDGKLGCTLVYIDGGWTGDFTIEYTIVEHLTNPVKVDDIGIISGGDVSIAYDATVLRAVDVSSHNNILMVSNTTEPGLVRLAFVNDGRLNGHTIAEVQFRILADGIWSPELQKVELYCPDALPLIPSRAGKEFRAMTPEHNALLQNCPNPFNPETWIPYQLAKDSEVMVKIHNSTGQLIRTMNLGYRAAGSYIARDAALHWDGTTDAGEHVASGVYYYSILAGEYTSTRKMIVFQ